MSACAWYFEQILCQARQIFFELMRYNLFITRKFNTVWRKIIQNDECDETLNRIYVF